MRMNIIADNDYSSLQVALAKLGVLCKKDGGNLPQDCRPLFSTLLLLPHLSFERNCIFYGDKSDDFLISVKSFFNFF